MTEKIHWRCFHCGETFTIRQAIDARDHFGSTNLATPACLMRVPGEYRLLRVLRKAERRLQAYQQQDTELHQTIHAMVADHQVALLCAEEEGYARGLSDGMKEGCP
jgi:hypothetical protein